MKIPDEIYAVIDETGQPIFSATWPDACHEHINDAIDGDQVEAATWVVRRYVLAPAKAAVQGSTDPHVAARFNQVK